MHRFHSMEYVAEWAKLVGNPVRESVFHHVLAHLHLIVADAADAPHVVELASGPGILAAFLLAKLPRCTYQGLDFSAPMLELARPRLAEFGDRAVLHQVDLRADDWPSAVKTPPRAIISMQALHDVGDAEEHDRLYGAASRLLAPGGLFLNADFVQRDGGGPSRISAATHLEMLRGHGFVDVKCTLELSRYGCIVGTAP